MVSAQDAGSRGPGSRPGGVNVLCSWEKQSTLTVPLSTLEYKWVLVNCKENPTLRDTLLCCTFQSKGGVVIVLVASYYMETGIRAVTDVW